MSHRLSGPPTDLPSYIPPHNQPPPTTIREETDGQVSPADSPAPPGDTTEPSPAAATLSPPSNEGTTSPRPSAGRTLSSRLAAFRRGSFHEDSREQPKRFPSIVAPKPVRIRRNLPNVLAAGASSRPSTAAPDNEASRGVSAPPRNHSTNPPFPPQPSNATPAFSPNSMKAGNVRFARSKRKRNGFGGWLASPQESRRACGGRFNLWKVLLLVLLLALIIIGIVLGIILGLVLKPKRKGSGPIDTLGGMSTDEGITLPTFSSTIIALPTAAPDPLAATQCLQGPNLISAYSCDSPPFNLEIKKASGDIFGSAEPKPGEVYQSNVENNKFGNENWDTSGQYVVSMSANRGPEIVDKTTDLHVGWNGVKFLSQPMIYYPPNTTFEGSFTNSRPRYEFTFQYTKRVIIIEPRSPKDLLNRALDEHELNFTLNALWEGSLRESTPLKEGDPVPANTLFWSCDWKQTDFSAVLYVDDNSFTDVATRKGSSDIAGMIQKRQLSDSPDGSDPSGFSNFPEDDFTVVEIISTPNDDPALFTNAANAAGGLATQDTKPSSSNVQSATNNKPKIVLRETRPTNEELRDHSPSGSSRNRSQVKCKLYYLDELTSKEDGSADEARTLWPGMDGLIFERSFDETIPINGTEKGVGSRPEGLGGCGCEWWYA